MATIFIPRKQGTVILDYFDFISIRNNGFRIEVSKRVKRNNEYLAVSASKGEPPNRIRTALARVILNYSGHQCVDHINRNSLDNRRSNLRLSNWSGNISNRKKVGGNKSSRFKGVTWVNSEKLFRASIGLNGKTKLLGRFKCEEDAARAYDKKALELFGEFAATNESLGYLNQQHSDTSK